MQTSMATRHSLAMALMLSAGTSFGLGGAAFGDEFEPPGVEVLDQLEESCPQRGGLCVAAGAPTTQAVAATDATISAGRTRIARRARLVSIFIGALLLRPYTRYHQIRFYGG